MSDGIGLMAVQESQATRRPSSTGKGSLGSIKRPPIGSTEPDPVIVIEPTAEADTRPRSKHASSATSDTAPHTEPTAAYSARHATDQTEHYTHTPYRRRRDPDG